MGGENLGAEIQDFWGGSGGNFVVQGGNLGILGRILGGWKWRGRREQLGGNLG